MNLMSEESRKGETSQKVWNLIVKWETDSIQSPNGMEVLPQVMGVFNC